MVIDNIRTIDYLRISVTDKCNLKCIYCIPKSGIVHKPHEELLRFEEIERIARISASLGVSKIRITGGEPLIRKDIVTLVKNLADIDGVEEVTLTTNGILLSRYVEQLKKAGLKRINISLDTLKADRFRNITGEGSILDIFDGIDKAIELDLRPIKLNVVVMNGVNEDEIVDFVTYALRKGITLRFIEFMKVTPLWNEDYFIKIEDVIDTCKRNFDLKFMGKLGSGPAVYYDNGKGGLLGFIKTHEDNCGVCNRFRLTSTGELKNCLYETKGLLLKELLRNGFSDDEIMEVVARRIHLKKTIDYRLYESQHSYMCSIGG